MRESRATKLFYLFNYLILGLIGLICLFPLVHELAVSFSDESAINTGLVSVWPVGFNTGAYHNLFVGTRIVHAFTNSVVITLVGTTLSMLATILTAYPMSRTYFFGRRLFVLLVLFTMLFNAGIIPTYIIMNSVHLINSWWAIWLLGLISPFNLFVMKTFFEGIHEELIEAARLDGAGEVQIVLRIVLPMSLPVIAALSLFYGVGYWNVLFQMLVFVQDMDRMNLAVFVQNMMQNQQMLMQQLNSQDPGILKNVTPQAINAAAVIVMIVPMLLVYPLLQTHFTKGMMMGSLKG
jgi:putative aldouronate transport system permease protein